MPATSDVRERDPGRMGVSGSEGGSQAVHSVNLEDDDRRRIGGMRSISRVCALALLVATATSAAAEDRRYYFTKPFALSVAVPNRAEPRDNVTISVRSGGSASLGEFVSAPLPEPYDPGAATVTLFLATGQQGMTACAEVGAVVTRIAPSGRTVIGNAVLPTSILPRRDAGPAIVLPVDVQGVVFAAGDQLAVEVVVGNACGAGRNVALLYDSLAAASRIDFAEPSPGTTTTSTTLGSGASTTTTSTLPPAVACGQFPSGTFAAVDCWFTILRRVVDDATAEAFGGARRQRRIAQRLARIARPLEKAEAGRRAAKRLAAVARRLAALRRKVDGLASAGRMDAPLGVTISTVAGGMSTEVDRLRAATP